MREQHGTQSVGVLASARLTMEENYLHPEARADGARDELRPLLRSHLTRSDSLRPGQVVGQRSEHQLHPGDRERRFLFVIGSNTTEAHPVLALRMKKAVRNGATLVVADPRKIWLTKLAERHLQLRPGSDVWLLNAMMHVILEEGLQDEEYIREFTEDFDAVREVVSRYTPEEAEQVTGVAAEDIRGDGARVRDRAARGDLLHARDHRARVRRRQHLVALEPRAHDRPPRLRVDRA